MINATEITLQTADGLCEDDSNHKSSPTDPAAQRLLVQWIGAQSLLIFQWAKQV